MYHNALVTKDHPQQAALEKAVELILAFSDANTVYFSPHLEEGLNAGIVIVIISKDSPHGWDELTDNYWKVFEAFPQFSFRIFDRYWVKQELKDGNPFFAMHCNKNSLVYSTAKSDEFLFVERLKPKRFLKKAKYRFRIDDESAFTLSVNVRFYIRRGNYVQAAYTLHQSIRWLYVAASWFLTGEWLVEHDLEIQQKHVGRFSKVLANAFDAENEAEARLSDILNATCRAIHDGGAVPEVTLGMVKAIQAKMEGMRSEVKRLFEECVHRCRYEFSRTKSPLIAIDDPDPLKHITQIVTQTVDASALYCFGERSISTSAAGVLIENNAVDSQNTHYYLFLIVREYRADVPGNIAYHIKSQTNGRCTATVVMHSNKSLRQRPGDQQHFFYRIMQRARLLYQETAKPPFLKFEKVPARDVLSAKIYWAQGDRTKSFLMEAEGLDGGGATKIHVYLMNLVIEQTCLGLIRVFLGYMPNHFSLSFLFELCEYFTPLTAEIFPRTTDKDKELLRILSGRTTSLRYGFIDDVQYHDYEVLKNRYHEFVERADKLAAAELERLERLNESSNPNT
ncbi:hypothetical protein HUK80_02045 [Flavobacterium sp. MAH-1]|uniref:Uncharacterized protein n=1 Tax=Flavobacterium agri TaxID=2743471 RepID=A0A7Y8XZA3_9FLAO|nr:hypothetical protein [Flavobacterium agri]NUY79662.1 hypothetical protein [Flavobacterium agri]NYA69687.1 hypothetical protein [Flavobacterium agri]